MEQETALGRVSGSRYLSKPFTAEELLHAVQTLMKESGSDQQSGTEAQSTVGSLI
jgi:DNA-binding response OmpR family regulator